MDELHFVTKAGLLPFLSLDWANVMVVLHMELVEEFINALDVNDKTSITARVRGWLVGIDGALIWNVLKLLAGSIIEPLVKTE